MDLGQLAWLAPVAVTLIVTIGFGLYLHFAVEVPQGWRGSQLAFSVSHSAFITPCFAIIPALGQVFGGAALLGLAVLLASVGVIVACVLIMRRLDGREHSSLWDWLAINPGSGRSDGPG